MFAGLDKYLYSHVVWDEIALYQHAKYLVLGLGSRWKADLYLLKSDFGKSFEVFELFLQVHRIDERLIAVAQVDAAPWVRS